MATGVLLANRWQILKKIGCGGMGTVYACNDSNLDKRVALKVLNEEWQDDQKVVARFHREIETLVGNSHPNIVSIHACSPKEMEPPVWLVMEFLDGPTLNIVLDESPNRRLHPQRILRIVTQMLDALETVHSHGIIHRDLKPENVFVLPGRRRTADWVKLVDFGIAKANETQVPTDESQRLTQVGTVIGTPFYMSPEQCLGSPNVDGRTDLYAVGVMLFEMATGRLPFVFSDKLTREDIMTAHIGTCPDSPRMINPEISPELEMVILRSLTKKPADRFLDANAFSKALEAAIPEDKDFYGDSQQVSPVNGRVVAAPPRVPTVAEEDRPTDERLDQTKTPTRLLGEKRPPAGIALAETITPTDLKREAARAKMDAAIQIAKNIGVWAWKPSRRAAMIAIGSTVFALIGLIILAALLPNSGKNATAVDGGVEVNATAAAPEKETSPQPNGQPDVIIRVPVPIPVPRNDAATDEPNNPPTATTVETDVPAVPADYAERLAEARRQESRGDNLVLRGRFEKALTTYQEALTLLPDGAENDKIRLRSKIGELERRLR
jgi:serine/threonine protein kinase